MSGFPEWVYEKVIFDLWMGLHSKEVQEGVIEKIKANYEDNDIIEICFHINWKISKDIKNLCDMRTQILLNFDHPQFDDDYVIIKINRKKLLEKFEWIKHHFRQIEINGETTFLWF